MIQSECYFASRTLASEEAAAKIISSLSAELTGGNEASFIVSGGSSPKACFNILAGAELAWNRVDVLMSDERYVAADHPDSNEGMTRRELLIRQAAEARGNSNGDFEANTLFPIRIAGDSKIGNTIEIFIGVNLRKILMQVFASVFNIK